MRRLYLLFFLSLSSFITILVTLNKVNYSDNKQEYISNNIQNIIKDSIDPGCDISNYELSNNSYIDLDEIEIRIPKIKKWSKNLIQAYIFSPEKFIINDKYKKRFDGQVIISSKGRKCTLPAKIRIHGDGFDHLKITPRGVISSLDIKLKKGNINGIINFKLFIPKTRNNESEIITVNLMRELGFLSPRTKLIKTKINKNSITKMIFQEKVSKEMLEKNFLRESALLGSNERIMWTSREKYNGNFTSYIYPKSKNIRWADKGAVNKLITLNGLNILAKAMNESWISNLDKEKSFSDSILSNGNKKGKSDLSKFRVFLIAMGAEHALHNNNRVFYYQPLNNYLVPIYYDGNSLIKEYGKGKNSLNLNYIKESTFLREINREDLLESNEKLKNLNIEFLKNNIKKSGVSITNNDLLDIKKIIQKNITLINENLEEKNNQFELNINKDYSNRIIKDKKYGLAFFEDTNNFLLCIKNNCISENLEDNLVSELINKGLTFKGNNYFYNGSIKVDKLPIKNEVKKFPITQKYYKKNLNIYKIGNPNIFIDYLNKIIKVEAYNKNDKIVIQDSNIRDWTIAVNGPNKKSEQQIGDRFDTKLITGMLTIKDSNLDNLNIYLNGGLLEDSLNIISSNGNLNKIIVNNSFQDAIDFDFSNLNINEISVFNAGNDCLDISAGNYYIKNISATICKDKGVSAGENSKLTIDNANLSKLFIAFVSKDSSDLTIKNGSIIKYNICASAYRKKQEYSAAKINLNKDLCDKKNIFAQKNSEITLKRYGTSD